MRIADQRLFHALESELGVEEGALAARADATTVESLTPKCLRIADLAGIECLTAVREVEPIAGLTRIRRLEMGGASMPDVPSLANRGPVDDIAFISHSDRTAPKTQGQRASEG